jgi:hypothetical protein
LLDVKTSILVFVHETAASVHEVKWLNELAYETGGYYILNCAYVDFERLYIIDQHDAFYVTRAKNNYQLKRISSAKANKSNGVIFDQHVTLKGYYSYKSYPKIFRRKKYHDA